MGEVVSFEMKRSRLELMLEDFLSSVGQQTDLNALSAFCIIAVGKDGDAYKADFYQSECELVGALELVKMAIVKGG